MTNSTPFRADPASAIPHSPPGKQGRGRFLDRLREFQASVAEHADLEILGVAQVEASEPKVYVRGLGPDGKPATYELAAGAIAETTWQDLEAVLTGRRPPRVLTYMSRIVGYFAPLHNWNRSKLAELRDRRRGIYGVPEAAVIPRAVHQELPADVVEEQLAGHADRAACELHRKEATK